MKKYISLIFGVFLLSLAACTEEIENPNDNIDNVNKIILSVKPSGTTVTRSADTDPESALALIDVYIMDEDYDMVYQERLDNTASPAIGGGDFTLKKNRDEFEAGKKYFVYIVANSTLDMADDWAELKSLTQRNSNVHLSGMNIVEVASGDMPPKYFLMDGFAYVGDDEPEDMAAYVINDTRTDDTVLNATLYRAAAKIIVNITQGESVEFHKVLDDAGPLYSFYQLPISTLVVNPSVSGARHTSDKQTTIEWGLSQNNFHWTTDDNDEPVITYVGYAYANDWSNNNPTNETALLFSIPMMWDADGNGSKEKSSPVNWYKVPVSKTNKFERNKCYVLNVNINAVGAEEKNVPLELRDIEYVTLDWQDVEVEIGENIAKYLTLNTDLVKIYDSNFDLDQLTFTSSSPIKSIKLKDVFGHNERQEGRSAFYPLELIRESDGTTEAEYEEGDGVYAYYIDKFGQKVQLGEDPGFDLKLTELPELTKEQILQLEKNLYKNIDSEEQHIRAVVPDEYKRALNGDIHIYSPIYPVKDVEELNWNSHFNTVRYLEFEVMNEQGLTATFRVEQSPTVIIKNEEGYFSYRSDQKFSEDQAEASHFHNYMGWKSFHLTGLMWGYEWDWTNNPNPQDEDFYVGNTSRDYSFVINDPNNVVQNSLCEVIHYGNWGAPHTFIDSRPQSVTYRYGGIYRSTTYPTGSFFRHRYYQFPGGQSTGKYIKGGYTISSKKYDHPRGDVQGLAIGPYYERDGRTYRKQFVWNIQPIFYNLYVSKVFEEDDEATGKHRGQANICSMTSSVTVDPGVMDGEWVAWGTQRFSNHRMYYVQTNNTHSDYTIGYPEMTDNEVPKNTPDNAHLISPGLMVASQLGETFYQSIINTAASYNYKVPVVGKFYLMAEEHCREYVETTFIDKPDATGKFNGVWDEGEEVIHYDDWRLPTKAEIDRIIEFQESSRAMDKLLVGQYYFCITGNGEDADINNKDNWVSNEVPSYTSTGYYIRCVRDAGRKK